MIPRVFFSVFFLVISVSFPISGSKEKEKTLAMIKPDGLLGNYTERIKDVIVDYGFSILREITTQLDQDSASRFYTEHSSKRFFPSLIKYMTSCQVLKLDFPENISDALDKEDCALSFDSGPVLVMVLEKENAIADWRTLIGPTDAIRAMCGQDLEKNCVHGSDSRLSAQREISFFFEDVSSGERITTHDEL
ncbi:NUCLEOSIDE DIPHOSPHATE KINASE [Salix purpurea]|uniref:NUCLEOSIDE DIPHOSPHATE KINASE n=1 Tax=Salix purpurea TaxID=77065 RepID=A0A9Q0QGJ2_SALPP|nr:NUCLEOSIDE DIPHOSPHATE KINASE [Salix purpurea]